MPKPRTIHLGAIIKTCPWGGFLFFLIFPKKDPSAQGTPTGNPHPLIFTGRQDLSLRFPVDEVIEILSAGEPLKVAEAADPVGLKNLPRKNVAAPEVSDLSLTDQVI
jgi:hypothetical protein